MSIEKKNIPVRRLGELCLLLRALPFAFAVGLALLLSSGCLNKNCADIDVQCGFGALLLGNQRPPSGSLDSSFGQFQGYAEFNDIGGVANAGDMVRGLTLDKQGRTIVSGNTTVPAATTATYVCRLNEDGSLDTTFASSSTKPGCLFFTAGGVGASTAGGLAVDAQGRAVFVGVTNTNQMFAARATADGALDASYGTGASGYITHVVGVATTGDGQDLVLDSQGRAVVVGRGDSGAYYDWVVWRLLANGSAVDTSFNGSGFVLTDFTSFSTAFGVGVTESGRIVVTGFGILTGIELRAYHSDGSADTSQNGTGNLNNIPSGYTRGYSARLVLDGFGNIFVVGGAVTVLDSTHDIAVFKFLPNGQVDTSFGGAGHATLDNPAQTATLSLDQGTGVALDAFGRVVVVGAGCNNSGNTCVAGPYSGYSMVVARFLNNGAADTTFNQGQSYRVLAPNYLYQNVFAGRFPVLLDPIGRILVGGGVDPDALGGGDGGTMRIYRIWP